MSELYTSIRRPLAGLLALFVVGAATWAIIGSDAGSTANAFLLTASVIAAVLLLVVTFTRRRRLLIDCTAYLIGAGALAVASGVVAPGVLTAILIVAIVAAVLLATTAVVLNAEKISDISVDRL